MQPATFWATCCRALDEQQHLTYLGRILARLPLDPHVAGLRCWCVGVTVPCEGPAQFASSDPSAQTWSKRRGGVNLTDLNAQASMRINWQIVICGSHVDLYFVPIVAIQFFHPTEQVSRWVWRCCWAIGFLAWEIPWPPFARGPCSIGP